MSISVQCSWLCACKRATPEATKYAAGCRSCTMGAGAQVGQRRLADRFPLAGACRQRHSTRRSQRKVPPAWAWTHPPPLEHALGAHHPFPLPCLELLPGVVSSWPRCKHQRPTSAVQPIHAADTEQCRCPGRHPLIRPNLFSIPCSVSMRCQYADRQHCWADGALQLHTGGSMTVCARRPPCQRHSHARLDRTSMEQS